MAYIYFDSQYAPGAFLIVKNGGNPLNEKDSILVQTDWDYPGVATNMGWQTKDAVQANYFDACEHDSTDGTVDCGECNLKKSDFITSAKNYIWDNKNINFESLDIYFEMRTWGIGVSQEIGRKLNNE